MDLHQQDYSYGWKDLLVDPPLLSVLDVILNYDKVNLNRKFTIKLVQKRNGVIRL
jgi:hypothetical protein